MLPCSTTKRATSVIILRTFYAGGLLRLGNLNDPKKNMTPATHAINHGLGQLLPRICCNSSKLFVYLVTQLDKSTAFTYR